MKFALLLSLVAVLANAQDSPAPAEVLRAQCVRGGEAAACRQALRLRTDDSELASAAGDAFMQSRRPAESILAYRRAQDLGFADRQSLNARMAGAESQRQSMTAVCYAKQDEDARRACDAALLPGAADEFRILQRRGLIFEALNKNAESLDDFLRAQQFDPQNSDLAAAILRQSKATGRNDSVALVGRGTALMALGRAADAVAPLQQALALRPGSRSIQSLLQGAQSSQGSQTLESTRFPRRGEQRFSNAAPASFSH